MKLLLDELENHPVNLQNVYPRQYG